MDFIVDRKVTFPSIYDPPMRTMIALGGQVPHDCDRVHDRPGPTASCRRVFLRALLAEDLEPVVRRLAAEAATDRGPQQ